MTPTGYNLLEGDWAVDLNFNDELAHHKGQFDRTYQSEQERATNQNAGATGEVIQPTASVGFQMAQPLRTHWRNRDHPFLESFKSGTTVATVDLQCIPFATQSYGPEPVFLTAEFYMVLDDDGIQPCADDQCPSFWPPIFRPEVNPNPTCAER